MSEQTAGHQAGQAGQAGRAIERVALCAWLALTTLLLPIPAAATCYEQAAADNGLQPELLRAIAAVESGHNPAAINRSHAHRTGTVDVGLMQINTGWLPALRPYGIQLEHLYDPCVNARVGAWILARDMTRLGNTWEAVGAYNAACTQLKGNDCQAARARYAWRVHQRLARSVDLTRQVPASAGTVTTQAPAPATTGPQAVLLSLRLSATASSASSAEVEEATDD